MNRYPVDFSYHSWSWKVWLMVLGVVCLGSLASMKATYAQESDVQTDEAVTLEDLGTTESQILPDSPLHFFKRLGWSLSEMITLNPVKKAELRMQHANEELSETKQLLEKKELNEKSTRAMEASLERYKKKVESVTQKIETIRERREQGDENVGELLDQLLDKHIKHQKVLEQVEKDIIDRAPNAMKAAVMDHLQEVKNTASERTGQFMGAVDDPEALRDRISRVLDDQKGSDLKELKHATIMRHMEEFAPEETRQVFEDVQEVRMKELVARLKQLPRQERANKIETYMKDLGGDEIRNMEMMDRLEAAGVPDDVRLRIENAKDVQAQRFGDRMGNMEEQFGQENAERMRNNMIEHFAQPDVDRLRTMQDINDRIMFEDKEMKEKMKQAEKESIEAFAATFTDSESQDQARRFEELSKKMAEHPDPKTLRLLQNLREQVSADPQKRAFIEQMESKTKKAFRDRMQHEPDQFLDKIMSDNPDDLEMLERMHEEMKNEEGMRGFETGPIGMPESEMDAFFDRAKKGFDEKANNRDARERQAELTMPSQPPARNFGMEREQLDQIFKEKLDKADNADERQKLLDQRLQKEKDLQKEELDERNKVFEMRLEHDELCDETCKQAERERMQNQHETENKRFKNDLQRLKEGNSNPEAAKDRFEEPFKTNIPPEPQDDLSGRQRDIRTENRESGN